MTPAPVLKSRADRPVHPVAEVVESLGCSLVLRRVRGPMASELFLHGRPPAEPAEPGRQAEAIYRAISAFLESEGGSFASVASETLFLRDPQAVVPAVRDGRLRALAAHGAGAHRPATTEIGQSPLEPGAWLEVMVHAVLPHAGPLRLEHVTTRSDCTCDECARAHGVVLHLGDEARFHAGGLCGAGGDAYEQTHGMLAHAERLLRQAGMEFSDVVRTWIYLRHMERDYPALNRARREFFAARGLRPFPASTGIYGAPPSPVHDLCLGVYAVKSGRPLARTVMTSATLNEAADYGADFTRGMKTVESNRVALHISGTASVDEQGRTAHQGDFDAQADRMLVNISALLERQGANFGDVVSAITYLKDPADAPRLRRRLEAAGFGGFPHALVEAEVCRPDLLCETEALAVVPVNFEFQP
jgi:enamine deaminase RidA (YjgF/YER057c/UK114 family)